MKNLNPKSSLPVESARSGNELQAHQVGGIGTRPGGHEPLSLLEIARNKLTTKKLKTAGTSASKEIIPIAPVSADACNNHFLEKNVEPVSTPVSSLLHVACTRKQAMQQATEAEVVKISSGMEARRQKALKQLDAAPERPRLIIADADSDPDHVILTIAIRHVAVAELLIEKSRYDPLLLLEMAKRYGKYVN